MSLEKPIRTLIMDDDAGQARLAQRTLERAGYAVEMAGDGDTRLALYATGVYDVLMLDHQMPRTGGLEVLRSLALRGAPRSRPPSRSTRTSPTRLALSWQRSILTSRLGHTSGSLSGTPGLG